MKHFFTALCAAALFSINAAEYVRPEVFIRPADQKCEKDCTPLCGNILRVQAWKIEDLNRLPSEKTALRCYLDKENFYVEVFMQDSDIISEAKDNKNPKLTSIADGIQILLHSEKRTTLWEINVTANDMSNCFFMPGSGNVLAASAEPFEVKREVTLQGTLNDSKDIDKSWSVKVTIPLSILRRKGLFFTGSENWTIMVYRSNFGRYLAEYEQSNFPQMLRNVYETTRFARLVFPEAK